MSRSRRPRQPGTRGHASRRAEAGHRAVLRHGQLDAADRAPRSRGDARARPCLPRDEPRRGAPLWRHGAAVHRRRLHGAVRRAAHPGRPCATRNAGGACGPAGARRRWRCGRCQAIERAGADRHSHRDRRLRPDRGQIAARLHGDRRHGQCRRPASSRPPSRERSWSAKRPGRWPGAMPGSSRSGR